MPCELNFLKNDAFILATQFLIWSRPPCHYLSLHLFYIIKRLGFTVEEASGLLGHTAGQHAIQLRYGAPWGLRAVVLLLYLPVRGRPAL